MIGREPISSTTRIAGSRADRLQQVSLLAIELDARDKEVLEAARELGALVLLIERAYRAGFFGGPRYRPDGAAPIIGHSPGIQAVRERIDRVAATDFTVLIEGSIGR